MKREDKGLVYLEARSVPVCVDDDEEDGCSTEAAAMCDGCGIWLTGQKRVTGGRGRVKYL